MQNQAHPMASRPVWGQNGATWLGYGQVPCGRNSSHWRATSVQVREELCCVALDGSLASLGLSLLIGHWEMVILLCRLTLDPQAVGI